MHCHSVYFFLVSILSFISLVWSSVSPAPYSTTPAFTPSVCVDGVLDLILNPQSGDLFILCGPSTNVGVVLKIPSGGNSSDTKILASCPNPSTLFLSPRGDVYAVCTDLTTSTTTTVLKWTNGSGVAIPLFSGSCSFISDLVVDANDVVYIHCSGALLYSVNGGAAPLVSYRANTRCNNGTGILAIHPVTNNFYLACTGFGGSGGYILGGYLGGSGLQLFGSFDSSKINDFLFDNVGNIFITYSNIVSSGILYLSYSNSTNTYEITRTLINSDKVCTQPGNLWYNNKGGLFTTCIDDNTIKLWTLDSLKDNSNGPITIGDCSSRSNTSLIQGITGSINSYQVYCGNENSEIRVFTSTIFDNPKTCAPEFFDSTTQKCTVPNQPNSNNSSSFLSDLSGGALAGIIIGLVFAIGIILFFIVLACCKTKKTSKRSPIRHVSFAEMKSPIRNTHENENFDTSSSAFDYRQV